MTADAPQTTDVDSIVWPEHKGSLSIEHNLHRSYYETVDKAIGTEAHSTYRRDDFSDEVEIAKAIAEDSVWTIQWYPNSPVGFCRVCAATLGRALRDALAAP